MEVERGWGVRPGQGFPDLDPLPREMAMRIEYATSAYRVVKRKIMERFYLHHSQGP